MEDLKDSSCGVELGVVAVAANKRAEIYTDNTPLLLSTVVAVFFLFVFVILSKPAGKLVPESSEDLSALVIENESLRYSRVHLRTTSLAV